MPGRRGIILIPTPGPGSCCVLTPKRRIAASPQSSLRRLPAVVIKKAFLMDISRIFNVKTGLADFTDGFI
jgi:hypothetical protein